MCQGLMGLGSTGVLSFDLNARVEEGYRKGVLKRGHGGQMLRAPCYRERGEWQESSLSPQNGGNGSPAT